MEEIKVGEYVRFLNGKIRKIIGIDVDGHLLVDIYISGSNWLTFNEEADIVKHSKNIIDLVQAGDIIRYKLKNLKHENLIEVKEYKKMKTGEKYLGVEGFNLEQIQILEILTKEQFARESYKVEEE